MGTAAAISNSQGSVRFHNLTQRDTSDTLKSVDVLRKHGMQLAFLGEQPYETVRDCRTVITRIELGRKSVNFSDSRQIGGALEGGCLQGWGFSLKYRMSKTASG